MMKKIVFITAAFVVQIPIINAVNRTSKVCPCSKPRPQQPAPQPQVPAAQAQPPIISAESSEAVKVCPCSKPRPQQPAPQQQAQQVQAQPPLITTESNESATRRGMIQECCQMIKDEAQKLSNSNHDLACEILEAVALTENQEMYMMRKYSCKQQEQISQPESMHGDNQHPPVPDQKNADESFETNQGEVQPVKPLEASVQQDSEAFIEITTKELLADCCLALADEALQTCDTAALERAEQLMKKVEMIPAMK